VLLVKVVVSLVAVKNDHPSPLKLCVTDCCGLLMHWGTWARLAGFPTPWILRGADWLKHQGLIKRRHIVNTDPGAGRTFLKRAPLYFGFAESAEAVAGEGRKRWEKGGNPLNAAPARNQRGLIFFFANSGGRGGKLVELSCRFRLPGTKPTMVGDILFGPGLNAVLPGNIQGPAFVDIRQ